MSHEHKPHNQFGDPISYFDRFAPQYNRISKKQKWPEQSAALLGKVVLFRDPGSINSYLDLGSGSGHTIDAVQRFSAPDRIVAVDDSKKMLSLLKTHHAGSQIEIVQARIEEYIPQSQEKFDLVTALSTLEFIKDLPPVIRQIGRLLRNQGIFAATFVPVPESGKKHHTVTSDLPTKTGSRKEKITEYYFEPGKIIESLASGGMSVLHEETIEAYKRDDETISYSFIIAQKES